MMSSTTQTFFTPVQTFLGGYLLHLSTSALLEDTGTVLGVSGIFDGVVWGTTSPNKAVEQPKKKSVPVPKAQKEQEWLEEYWRLAILGGILLVPITAGVLNLGAKGAGTADAVRDWEVLAEAVGWGRLGLAGLLVGLGSRLGSGCTSGHFLCGASRLSPRSLVATATFFPVAMITAYLFPVTSGPTSLFSPASYSPIWPTSAELPSLFLPIVIAIASRVALRHLLASRPTPYLRLLPYLLSGWTFGMGLVMSGMANPLKVLSFVRIAPLPQWDPSLGMVFLGGVVPNALSYQRLMSRAAGGNSPKPRYSWASWRVTSRKDIDWRLVLGSAVFGIGWGLAGVCPGPALVGLGSAALNQALGVSKDTSKGLGVFMLSMVMGMKIGRGI